MKECILKIYQQSIKKIQELFAKDEVNIVE